MIRKWVEIDWWLILLDRFDSFEREKLLNFKIPQGNFVLMNYK